MGKCALFDQVSDIWSTGVRLPTLIFQQKSNILKSTRKRVMYYLKIDKMGGKMMIYVIMYKTSFKYVQNVEIDL